MLLPRAPAQTNGKRIALIGAGPASLTVARDLAPLGYEVTTGVGGTGVVAILKNGSSNRAVGLRADIDAARRIVLPSVKPLFQ